MGFGLSDAFQAKATLSNNFEQGKGLAALPANERKEKLAGMLSQSIVLCADLKDYLGEDSYRSKLSAFKSDIEDLSAKVGIDSKKLLKALENPNKAEASAIASELVSPQQSVKLIDSNSLANFRAAKAAGADSQPAPTIKAASPK